MTRSRRKRRNLSEYTLSEELVNAISHGIGFGLAIAGGVLCIIKAASLHGAWEVVAASLYLVYTMSYYCLSTLHHAFSSQSGAKTVFRKISNSFSYVLIMGVYLPYVFGPLLGVHGWIMFGVAWLVAATGIVFSCVDCKISNIMRYASYVVLALGLLVQAKTLIQTCGIQTLYFFVGAGLLYTISAIVFGIKNRKKYFHSVFHFLCIGASVLYFFGIYLYVL